jgi:hypothetical protein
MLRGRDWQHGQIGQMYVGLISISLCQAKDRKKAESYSAHPNLLPRPLSLLQLLKDRSKSHLSSSRPLAPQSPHPISSGSGFKSCSHPDRIEKRMNC